MTSTSSRRRQQSSRIRLGPWAVAPYLPACPPHTITTLLHHASFIANQIIPACFRVWKLVATLALLGHCRPLHLLGHKQIYEGSVPRDIAFQSSLTGLSGLAASIIRENQAADRVASSRFNRKARLTAGIPKTCLMYRMATWSAPTPSRQWRRARDAVSRLSTLGSDSNASRPLLSSLLSARKTRCQCALLLVVAGTLGIGASMIRRTLPGGSLRRLLSPKERLLIRVIKLSNMIETRNTSLASYRPRTAPVSARPRVMDPEGMQGGSGGGHGASVGGKGSMGAGSKGGGGSPAMGQSGSRIQKGR